MNEYGTSEAQKGIKPGEQGKSRTPVVERDQNAKKEVEAALMQAEERNTGAVTWDVYRKYLRFCGGLVWAPIIICLLLLNESSQGEFLYAKY